MPKSLAQLLAERVSSDLSKRAKIEAKRKFPFTCKLKELRTSLKLSRIHVADATGMSRQNVINIENGHGVTLETAYRIALFFDKKIEDIWIPLKFKVNTHA